MFWYVGEAFLVMSGNIFRKDMRCNLRPPKKWDFVFES